VSRWISDRVTDGAVAMTESLAYEWVPRAATWPLEAGPA
jgi:hypothetical protein